MPSAKQKSVGPVVGIIIIVIVLVIGALYFWGAQLNRQSPEDTSTPPLSSSDSIENINADLTATAIQSIDRDVDLMGAELTQ